MAKRNWQSFPGRNKFYCNGLLMTAPYPGIFYLTCFLIIGTSTLFFIFDCPFLIERIGPVIPVVGGVLCFFVMASLLRTTCTDPGIIPRAYPGEEASLSTNQSPPNAKEIVVNGETIKVKYCNTCKIFRPPRATHCSYCDNCIDRCDHHCPWVGNCVGRRNYRFFYLFLVSLTCLTIFLFTFALIHFLMILKTEEDVWEILKKSACTLITMFICFLTIFLVGGLTFFHTYLVLSNQTTNEIIKGTFKRKCGEHSTNPYASRNICVNCGRVLCAPLPPSLINRRGKIIEEQQESPHLSTGVSPAKNVSTSIQIDGKDTPPPILKLSCISESKSRLEIDHNDRGDFNSNYHIHKIGNKSNGSGVISVKVVPII